MYIAGTWDSSEAVDGVGESTAVGALKLWEIHVSPNQTVQATVIFYDPSQTV